MREKTSQTSSSLCARAALLLSLACLIISPCAGKSVDKTVVALPEYAVDTKPFGRIGITYFSEKTSSGTLWIYDVERNSPASENGLKKGDQIVAIDGKNIRGLSTYEIPRALAKNAGEHIVLGILSEGENTPRYVRIKVGKTPQST